MNPLKAETPAQKYLNMIMCKYMKLNSRWNLVISVLKLFAKLKKGLYLTATFFVVLAYSNGYTTLYQIMILPFVSVCVCAPPLVWLSLIFNRLCSWVK